jgi:hypothetical protein
METKSAPFYRGYLPDDCSFIPLTIALATIVALWLLIFLAVCPHTPVQNLDLLITAWKARS